MASDLASVLDQLSGSKKTDYLRVVTNKQLVAYLTSTNKSAKTLEVVQFSDSVVKINKRGREQERHLIITNHRIYNFVPGKYKQAQRIIPIRQLRGIAISKDSDEFLFQVQDEYDYRMRIVRRAEVLEVVSQFYRKLMGSEIEVAVVDDVTSVQVTKEMMKKQHKSRKESASTAGASGGGGASAPASSDSLGVDDESAGVPKHQRLSSDAVPQPESEEQVVQGFLSKKGNSNNIWRKRYFRLSDAFLVYSEARTKGSTTIRDGSCQLWRNYRYSVAVREAQEASTPDHLLHIFQDPERRQAFVDFCQSKYYEENALFYISCDEYRALGSDPATPEAELLERAKSIVDKFVRDGCQMEINASPGPRGEVAKEVDAGHVSPTMFDGLQQLVLSIMRVEMLPQYLAHAGRMLADEDFHVKTALTEDDKQHAHCNLCTREFNMLRMRGRKYCQHCNRIFCAACVSKTTDLPPEFAQPSARVCDICYGWLNASDLSKYHVDTHFAFTYASQSRKKPLNLAAGNSEDAHKWVRALNRALDRNASRAASSSSSLSLSTLTGRGSSAASSAAPDTEGASMEGAEGAEGAEGTQSAVTMEGWLWKEDPRTLAWRRRYFVLDGERLWYYDFAVKGSISVSQGLNVFEVDGGPTLTAEEATFGGFTSKSNFSFRFNIMSDRAYNVAADTEEERNYWMENLQKAIHKNDASIQPELPDELSSLTDAFHQEAPQGQVTFVFTDVQSSTKLWEADPDGMNEALEIHDEILREQLKLHRGYEVKTEGDAFMVTFFTPIDAIKWCVDTQHALLNAEWPESINQLPYAEVIPGVFAGIRVRMGIHTGEPACRANPITSRMDYFGPVVNRSARISDSAHGGQIVCTTEVHDHLVQAQKDGTFEENVVVEELGDFPYKGIPEPVKIFQISPVDLVKRNPFPKLRVHEEEAPAAPAASGGGPEDRPDSLDHLDDA